MIDTVVIILSNNQFKIMKIEYFDGKSYKTIAGRFSVERIFPKKLLESYKKQGIYFPIVEIVYRKERRNGEPREIRCLEIQVSLPKVVCGTNFFEIDIIFLPAICSSIVKKLGELGVVTSEYEIRKAIIKKVDFSKVIFVPIYFGIEQEIIKRMAFFDYKYRSEFTLRDFGKWDSGIFIKFVNRTQTYTIYGKSSEIIANGYTAIEQKIASFLLNETQKKNVLKFELSLRNKQSVEAFLRRRIAGKDKDFTLEDVLNEELAKNVLSEVFNKVFNPESVIIYSLSEMQDNELESYFRSRGLSYKERAMTSYAVSSIRRIGLKSFRENFIKEFSYSTYSRMNKELELITDKLGNISDKNSNIIDFLRKEHQKFELYKIRA
jgi:hypothetical protein